MENNLKNLYAHFHKLLNRAISKEKAPRVLPNGEILYRIEIHVIVAIAENPEFNLTELSEFLGVTKGAVSQKVKILIKKQYIEKLKKDNNKEILFKLTPKGKKIFYGHQEFHKSLNEKIKNNFGNIDSFDFEKIINILKIIESHFETL